jgi:uncharacterized repeat protein (TIGR03803 family)
MQLTSLLRVATLAVLSVVLLTTFQKAHAQTESTLYSFCPDSQPISGSCVGGQLPYGSLISDGNGGFYGTTSSGGRDCPQNLFSCVGGVIFQLIPQPTTGCPSSSYQGNGWCEIPIYLFCSAAGSDFPDCPDGASPYANLLAVKSGPFSNPTTTLYGTTYEGGSFQTDSCPIGCGVVFALSPAPLPEGVCPSGTNPGFNGWCESVIYPFYNTDGNNPMSGLVRDSAGNLYGTTNSGVYELSPNGSGGWSQSFIYNDYVFGGLAIDASGNLYGVDQGGVAGGNVFKLVFDQSSHSWIPTIIHAFSALPDGQLPYGQPVVDSAGNVYGTTSAGGKYNYGTVWKLTLVTTGAEAGTYKEKILHAFVSPTTGDYPYAGVILDSTGNIYGTTNQGGKYSGSCENSNEATPACGTVFELKVSGTSYAYKLLWSFNAFDGAAPVASLLLNSSGELFGTTLGGGSYGGGTVFAVNPVSDATTTTLASSPNPSISGETVTFTATVSSSAGAPPDGVIVNFMKGTTLLGTGTTSGGSATFMTSSLAVGTSAVHAVYFGNLDFKPSTSKTLDQVVKK